VAGSEQHAGVAAPTSVVGHLGYSEGQSNRRDVMPSDVSRILWKKENGVTSCWP